MTTGRINQVAILGHTGGPRAACSDSTLSARLRGRAPPTGLPDLKSTKGARGAMEGPRRSRATARPLTGAGQPSTGWGAIVRHRVPAATKGGGRARAAAQSPITRKPANTRPNGTMQAAARKHAVDMGHLGPKKRRGMVEIRGTPPKAGSVPRTRLRLPRTGDGPRRFRRRPHRLACNVPGSGPGRGTEETVNTAPPSRAEHRPVKSHAPHRRGRARRVSRSPVPARHTRVRDPPYRYKPHMSSRRAKTRRLP